MDKKAVGTVDSNSRRKRILKKICLVLAGTLIVLAAFAALLFYTPAGYEPAQRPPRNNETRQISRYLTHVLLPKLYNGTQLNEPFEMVLDQDGVNEIIASADLSKELEAMSFSTPMVRFVPGAVVLMVTMTGGGAELVVTIRIEPVLDEQGFLNLPVRSVTAGAVNVTPFAKALVRQIYFGETAEHRQNVDDPAARVLLSLIDDVPFEPVFDLDGGRLRAEKITVEAGKLTVLLAPAEVKAR